MFLRGQKQDFRAGDHGKIFMEHTSEITTMADFVNNRQDLCIAFFAIYQFY